MGFHRWITVPNNVPDGVYAFAFLWYGGIDYRRKVGKFSDYSSCSYVRVEGGERLESSLQPFFDAGDVSKYVFRGMCLTSATRPGECRRGCDHKPCFHALPDIFRVAHQPEAITAGDYDAYFRPHNGTERGDSYSKIFSSPSPSGFPIGDMGVCKDGVCCASICGICKQKGCIKRTGDFQNCCPLHIIKTGRKCENVGAPCFENGRGRRFM